VIGAACSTAETAAADGLVTAGTLWRGIGPQKGAQGGTPYRLGPGGCVEFTDEAFYDRPKKHPADPNVISMEISCLLDSLAGSPLEGLRALAAAAEAKQIEALTGLTVRDVLAASHVPSNKGHPDPGKASSPEARTMMIVHQPEARLPAHAVITLRQRWAPKKDWKLMRRALAELATDYHRQHGWVLAPAA
jgi:hypothetical protein